MRITLISIKGRRCSSLSRLVRPFAHPFVQESVRLPLEPTSYCPSVQHFHTSVRSTRFRPFLRFTLHPIGPPYTPVCLVTTFLLFIISSASSSSSWYSYVDNPSFCSVSIFGVHFSPIFSFTFVFQFLASRFPSNRV